MRVMFNSRKIYKFILKSTFMLICVSMDVDVVRAFKIITTLKEIVGQIKDGTAEYEFRCGLKLDVDGCI